MLHSGLHWLDNLPPWDGSNFTPFNQAEKIFAFLGNPQDAYPSLHIAGTNGKGTVASLTNHILVESKTYKKIGLMTSPHIFKLNERCQINSVPVKDFLLDEALVLVKEACQELVVSPTYFVAITAAIFLVFKKAQVDFAVIEVGLGGRNDTTNLIKKPKLTVITSIGLDHQEQLGENLESIALNKAGIIKEEVDLLLGELPTEAKNVILSEAKKLNVPVSQYKKDFYLDFKTGVFERSLSGFCLKTELTLPTFLPGYLQTNFGLAITSAERLGLKIKSKVNYLENYFWPRRFNVYSLKDKVSDPSRVIIDGAHNIDGVNALLEGIDVFKSSLNLKSIKLVFAFLLRKRWEESLKPIIKYFESREEGLVELIPFCPNEEFVSLDEYQRVLPPNSIISKDLISESDYDEFLASAFKTPSLIVFFGSLKLPQTIEASLSKKFKSCSLN